MEWYQFSPKTGEYTRPVQCQKNPKGGYLIPANATPVAPPEIETNQAAVFDGEQWQLIADHRGTVVYSKADKTESTIKELGEIPETQTTDKPQQFDQWDGSGWVLDQALKDQHDIREWKIQRTVNVANIVVTVDGMPFDGDEISQQRMTRVITVAESDTDTMTWVLADNVVKTVTVAQLKQALMLAGQEQARLWIPEIK
ncbi:DUF4376 domain-containing protein [Endozoicomonas montiporae]|uniref:Tail fiber assembly protein n=1 Tax=Endozoicomonas montiporae CL-33 TaxID=570277 RepID=A0A142BD05_9GAMM|nr:DUF4376 domain-containing protein [Endozoicomonas montiporae]AMO56631.1 tail fiber assembly protein [Endozoicomonas montiporae CL-33]